jgi:hypothetical protein
MLTWKIRRRQLTDVWNIGEKTIRTLDTLDSWCSRRKTTRSMFDKIQQRHQRIDEQEERLWQALISLQSAVRNLLPTLLVESPMGFTELATADVGALRTTFVDR